MATMEQAYIQVEWDAEHTSPVIGPYPNITAANRDAREMRRIMRANGHPFRRVRTHYLRSPSWFWALDCFWPRLGLVEEDET